jgi:cell shape-determining protein MreC
MIEKIKYGTVSARIIHNNSFIESQSFIARSTDERVASGNIVVSNSYFMLGTISERTGRYAKVRSLRDSHSNIPVRIAGTDIFGFLQGAGNSAPELRFLSDGDFVPEVGMILLSSGVKGNMPDDIPIGRIESVRNYDIRVKLGAELKHQESVVILLFDRDMRYDSEE